MKKPHFFDDLIGDDEDLLKGYPELKQHDQQKVEIGDGASVIDTHEGHVKSTNARVKTSLYITPSLLRRLKIYCAKESLTMSEVLEKCISAFLDRKEKLHAKREYPMTD